MPWARFDDKFITNPKLRHVGLAAKALWVWSIGWCNAELTDGLVEESALPILAAMIGLSTKEMATAIAELTRERLWEPAEGGHFVHHFLEFNKSRAQVEEEREQAKQRMQLSRSPEVRANTNRTSAEVRANNNGSSGDVRKKFNDPVPVPVPVPVPMHGRDVMSNSRDEEDGFARFWAAYPRKAGKNKARQWWTQRLAEGVSADDMIMAAEHYAAKLKRDHTEERYMKMPANFLGPEECWQDYASPPDDDEEEEHYQTIEELRASLAAEPKSGLTW